MEKKKTPSFFMNVITIIFAQIAVKLLGFVYRMVITNIDGFGDVGNGYYNFGYQIYTLLLSISSIGIPSAISKLVAERCALDDFKGAMRIFRVAMVLFSVIGLAFSCIMFFGAEFIATKILDAPLAIYTIRVLSPAILFVSVSSVIRGFYAGQQNMQATNTSQVLEQFLKSLSTILIVIAMTGQNPEYMAAGATLATTISTILSLGYLFVFHAAHKKKLKAKVAEAPQIKISSNRLKIAKMILLVSAPISLGAIVSSLNRVVDLVTVIQGLKTAFSAQIPDAVKLNEKAVQLSGILSKTDVLTNLPLALNTAFATVLVPTVAGALATGDYATAKSKTSFSILVSIIVALPCTVGYMVLAGPILQTIYPNAPDGALLFILISPTVFFSSMSQTIYGSLQGMGKIYIPAISVLCGGIVKVILNLILIPIPEINIYGAPIGSVACQAVAFFISYFVLRKNLPMQLSFTKFFIKPLIASLVMGGCAMGAHSVLMPFIGNAKATIAAIGFGVIIYFAMVIVLKIFDKEELSALPIIGKKFKQ